MGKLTNAILKNKAAGGTAPAAESQQGSKLRSAILQAKNPVKEQEEKKVNSPAARSGLSRDVFDSRVRNGYRERLEAEQQKAGTIQTTPGGSYRIPGSTPLWEREQKAVTPEAQKGTPVAGIQVTPGSSYQIPGSTPKTAVNETTAGAAKDWFGSLVSGLGTVLQTANAKNPANQAVQIIEQMQGENASPVVKGAADLEREKNAAAKQNAELIRKAGSELSAKGQAQMQQAKVGQSAGAQAALDLVGVGTQMVLDIGLGALTKLGMMAPMAARVFGSSAEKAAAEGADLEQQVTYGLASAGVAYALEKISNVAFAGLKIVNPGITDDVVKKAIDKLAQKLAKTPKGAAAVKAVASLATSMGGEGLEEFLEAVADPYLQKATYNQNAATIFEDPELLGDALYSAMLGAILGGVGGGADVSINTLLETGADSDLKTAYREYQSFYTDEAVNEAYEAMVENKMFSDADKTAAQAANTDPVAAQSAGDIPASPTPQTAQSGPETGGNQAEQQTASAQQTAQARNPAQEAAQQPGNIPASPAQQTAQSAPETGGNRAKVSEAADPYVAQAKKIARNRKLTAQLLQKSLSFDPESDAYKVASEFKQKVDGGKRLTWQESLYLMHLNDSAARGTEYADAGYEGGQEAPDAVSLGQEPNTEEEWWEDEPAGMAVETETAPAATEAAEAVSTEPAPMMAGQEGAEYAGEDRVSGDRGRRAGAAAGEPGRRVAQGTGRRQNREVQNIRGRSRADDVSFAYEHAGAEPVSTRDLYGDERGSEDADLREAPRSVIESDEELRGLDSEIRQAGYEPHFFTGMARLKSGQPCPAYFDGNRVFIRIDHPKWTATELWDHEKFHGIKDKDPGIVDRIWTQLAKTTDREQLQNTLKVYRDRYHGAYDVDAEGDTVWNVDVMQKIVEEILADAYAGRDAFGTGVEDYTETVREMAGQTEEETAEARGPPEGRFAIEQTADGEKMEKSTFPAVPKALNGSSANGGAQRKENASGKTVPQQKPEVKGSNAVDAAEEGEAQRQLEKQNRRLQRQNQRLQEQLKLTDIPKRSRKAVEEISRDLRSAYSSKIDKDTLSDRLEALYDEMAQTSSAVTVYERSKAPSWETIRKHAAEVAREILDHSLGNVNPMYEEYGHLRQELKGRKISIAEKYRPDLESAGGYSGIRKKNFGTFSLSDEGTPIDVVYEELSMKYPGLFPDDVIHPADQLLHLSDVLGRVKKVEGNPFKDSLGYTEKFLAGEIEELFYDMPRETPTKADKLLEKYRAERKKDRQLTADKLYNQKKAYEREMKKLEQTMRDEAEQRMENQNAAQRRETIYRHANRLGKTLLRPTDKRHIPEQLQGAVLQMLKYIDPESSFEWAYQADATYKKVKPGTELGAEPTSRTAAARALKAALEELENAPDENYSIDPDMGHYLEEIAQMGNKPLRDMTRDELDKVWKVLQIVEHQISRANDILEESRYRTVDAMANALLEENGRKKARGDWAGKAGELDKLVSTDMMAAETFLHRMGEAGDDLYRQMRSAQDRQTTILKEGVETAAKLVEKSGVNFKKLDKELHTFDVAGGKLTLSTSQIMELYALNKRKQAQEHIYIGGLKPVEAKKGLKEVGSPEPVKVTIGDVAEILKVLTPEQTALMDGLQKYLSTDLAKHGNRASMDVYGYRKFKESSYWPIKVSNTETKSDPAAAARAKMIPGYGMTKPLTPKAKNPVELRSALDSYVAHLNQMATYSAWLSTNETINRVYNFKFQDENSKATVGTVKRIFERVYGKNGGKYLENLLGDIAQGTKAGADRFIGESGLNQFKAAKVGGNLRVIIQQPTAMIRAANMINPKYFVTAKSQKKGWEKAKKYAPIAQWKDWGYFEIGTGRSLRELIVGSERGVDSVKNAFMAPAGAADSLTWGHLWNAVEAETLAKHPEIPKNSEAFYEEAGKRFSEIIDRTQVVDSVLHRTQIMRSSNAFAKLSTSFMSEPSKIYNMVQRDLYDLRSAEGDRAKKTAGKRLARSTTALIASFAVNAAAQAFIDALRDDEREKDYWEKWMEAYWGFTGDEETAKDYWSSFWAGNFVSNFDPLGYIPYIKDLESVVQGYTASRSELEGFADLVDAFGKLMQAAKGEGKQTIFAAGLDAASRMGDLLGLPVSNIKRDVMAAVNTALNEAGAQELQYKLDKALYSMENSKGTFYSDLYRAMDTDEDAYLAIYEDLRQELIDQGMTEEEADEDIKSNVENRMKKDLGIKSLKSLPYRYSKPGEDPEFDQLMAAAENLEGGWIEALPEGSAELAKDLNDMDEDATNLDRILEIGFSLWGDNIKENAMKGLLSDNDLERYYAAKEAGIDAMRWCEAYVFIKQARIDRTGKNGSPSQEDVEKGLNMTDLTKAQKAAIWDSYKWKKMSPWG